jgi:hypothetical protein
VDELAKVVARKAAGDAVVWFAYPKGTSKKYKSNLTRDSRALVSKEARKRVARR